MHVATKYPTPQNKKGRACVRKAMDQFERHQMGFDGESIGEKVLRDTLKYKGVELTRHKAKFDIVTKSTAWEVKTVGRDSKYKQMNVKPKQKKEKLKWAKEHKKKPKSMLIIVNDTAEVFIKDGIGKFIELLKNGSIELDK